MEDACQYVLGNWRGSLVVIGLLTERIESNSCKFDSSSLNRT
jgi:hypothetical protein